ncbi:uncharacterized protein LOC110861232 [Folsomia candida]|uniref:uncharacterized protein LOC110861232 n=1 Tax=Folsomia candida TaxID=158441 RepID=UPI000B8F4D3C|nr:uncharacterized protein LOC110861232 [Folsomia candida]
MSINPLKLLYFTITSTFLVFTECSTNSNIIQIQGLPPFDGAPFESSTYYNPTIPTAPSGRINKLVTSGECFNIYPQENCTGSFIRANMFVRILYDPETDPNRWVGDDLIKEDLRIASVGPCFDRCDPRNWQNDEKLPVEVTFYEDNRLDGNKTTIMVDTDGCFLITRRGYHSSGMKISGDANACVELHSAPSCGGEFTQFRPGYIELNSLINWNLGDANDADAALAVSRCGAFCNKSVPLINPDPLPTALEKNMVTFYDYFGFYGHPTSVNLSAGCVKLDEKKFHRSIRTYGRCVVLYALEGCKETRGYHVLQTDGKSGDYYVQKLLAGTSPYYPKSIRLCGKHEKEADYKDRDDCDAGGFCMTLSSTSILLGSILFLFYGMVLISLSALGGILIYKLFENQGSHTATLYVVYKSEVPNV